MDRNRRILLLCQHYYPEMISTGMHMTELAGALSKEGFRMRVLCAQPALDLEGGNEAAPWEMEHEGVHISRVHAAGSHSGGVLGRLLLALGYLAGCCLRSLRSAASYDVMLATTNPPFIGLAGALVRRLLGKPYVLIVYDIYPDIVVRLGVLRKNSLAARLWEGGTRLILRNAAALVVIGRDMAEIVKAKLSPRHHHKLRLIPNWSDEATVYPVPRAENRFRAESGAGNRFVIQYSGRMARTHNLEPLVEAAELLRHRDVLFQFIGDGAKKRLLMDMVRLRKLDNVSFHPYQPLSRLAETLSGADLSVVCLEEVYSGLSVPSKAYGIMASGVPLLGFLDPRSEIGRTIIENDCGLVLQDPTGAQVARLIESLLDDPGRLRGMGERARAAFLAGYTLKRSAGAYAMLLEEVLLSCNAASGCWTETCGKRSRPTLYPPGRTRPPVPG